MINNKVNLKQSYPLKTEKMNKLFILLILLISLSAKADTISSWKVYYNKTLVKQLSDFTSNEIKIKASYYKKGDYLAITYSDDTRCNDCSYEITVVAEGKESIHVEKFKDEYKLARIDLKQLIDNYKSRNSNSLFVVYFTEIDKKGKRNRGTRLLTIEIN